VGLSAGLLLALVFAFSFHGRTEPAKVVATRLTAAPVPTKEREPRPPVPAPEAPSSAPRTPLATEGPPATSKAQSPPATGPPAWSFDHWLQDFDRALQQARDQGKDVLLLFDSSDWSDFSKALAREVFGRAELWERLTARFVPVHIDFPEYPRATRRVQDARRNEALQARFFKHPAYPRLVLTDADGRPYAVEMGYVPGQAEEFVGRMEAHREKRQDRDEILADVEKADGEEKLRAAEAALNFLAIEIESPVPRDDGTYALGLAEFYAPVLKQFRALADEHDPKNAGGYRERFFRANWGRRERTAMADPNSGSEALKALTEEFDAWRESCRFKDHDLAADLLYRQAELALRLGDPKRAERVARSALALNPSPAWQRGLERILPPKPRESRGTGFAVAPGYVVTNYHVVEGPGEVRVRIPGRDSVESVVLAYDEVSDLALLKVALPPKVTLAALHVAPAAPARRGTEVMALGYALDGETLKFTRGSVSAREEGPASGTQLIMLDQRVNPGNSGGPLCDACGNVVGLVTAKTISTGALDSYGIAVGAEALDRFLSRHLAGKGYRPSPPLRQRYEWAAIDRWVSPSVVLVLKGPG
jgi:S1-C subfamily serine protease/thioredoxin-related protein